METSSITPFRAVHPGGILGDELRERGIKRKDFALQTGMRPSHLSELIRGKRSFTPKVAERIAAVLGIPAADWVALQKQYEADLAAVRTEKKRQRIILKTDGYAPDTGTIYRFQLGLYIYEDGGNTYACCPSLNIVSCGKDYNDAIKRVYEEFGEFVNGCKDNDDLIAKFVQRGWKITGHSIHPPTHIRQERFPQVSWLLANQVPYSVAYAPVSLSITV